MTNEPIYRMDAEPETPVSVKAEFAAEATFAEAAAGESAGPRRFEMLAYTGKPMRPKIQPPLKHPVVVDLAGVDMSKQVIPVLRDHDPKEHVGHTEAIESDGTSLKARGVVSGVGRAAKEVVGANDNGFRWQVSIGADLQGLQFFAAGQSVAVNGRAVQGPVYVARKSRLREISFLTMGADDDTVAQIAAEAAEGEAMSFEDWLKANGFQPENLSDKQRTTLQAAYDAEQAEGNDAATANAAAGDGQADTDDDSDNEAVASLRAEVADIRREQQIIQMCAGHPDIAEKAIKSRWSDDTIKLAIEAKELRSQLPQSIQIRTRRASDAPDQGAVMEAALCAAGGIADAELEKQFDDKVLTEAHRQFRGRIGLQELLLEAAIANGYQGRAPSAIRTDLRGVMQSAFSMNAGGFSTTSLSGILSNAANKFLLAGFNAVESAWRQIAAIRPVTDFKQITSYRLTGNFEYEEVGPDGQLKHGTVDEESFTNQAKTYGRMFAITRTNIINDDLGAFTGVPTRIGRGAALKLNKVFWSTFMDNATFFTAGNGNYFDGANSALSIDSLTKAEQMFFDQTDPDGDPLGIMPQILLVPNALNVTATSLARDTEIRNTTASTVYTTGNPHAGKFTPVRSSYLSNSSITGNSTTAWYLLASPADLPVIEVVFLNGRQEPTVESADADFNTLGIQFRGYHDFGVAKQDYRGGVKSKGAQ